MSRLTSENDKTAAQTERHGWIKTVREKLLFPKLGLPSENPKSSEKTLKTIQKGPFGEGEGTKGGKPPWRAEALTWQFG